MGLNEAKPHLMSIRNQHQVYHLSAEFTCLSGLPVMRSELVAISFTKLQVRQPHNLVSLGSCLLPALFKGEQRWDRVEIREKLKYKGGK